MGDGTSAESPLAVSFLAILLATQERSCSLRKFQMQDVHQSFWCLCDPLDVHIGELDVQITVSLVEDESEFEVGENRLVIEDKIGAMVGRPPIGRISSESNTNLAVFDDFDGVEEEDFVEIGGEDVLPPFPYVGRKQRCDGLEGHQLLLIWIHRDFPVPSAVLARTRVNCDALERVDF